MHSPLAKLDKTEKKTNVIHVLVIELCNHDTLMREGCCLNLENYRMDGRVDNYKDHKKYLSYKETNKIIFFTSN